MIEDNCSDNSFFNKTLILLLQDNTILGFQVVTLLTNISYPIKLFLVP